MASIGEMANEAKALLEDIKSNTQATSNNTGTIINQLGQLVTAVGQVNTTAQLGFTNLAQGLAALIQLQIQNNDLLADNNKQNVTIICWLDHIAHVLCDIKHNTDAQIRLQTQISMTLAHMDDVMDLVHAREAVEISNQYALQKRIEECCKEEEPPPQPCFEDCNSPRLLPYDPVKPAWLPIRYSPTRGDQAPK